MRLKVVIFLLFLSACGGGSGGGVSNAVPQLTSATTANVVENNTNTGYTATASDLDSDPITFTITGGDDAAAFSLNSSSGVLVFNSAPDYENATDADGLNTYVVVVRVSDGKDFNSYTITITVTNQVNEGSSIKQYSLPRTGQALCYDGNANVINCTNTGQDGESLSGVILPVPRFTNHANGTATDNLTGIMWPTQGNIMTSRDNSWDTDGTSGDGAVNWQHALDYVAKLNAESYLSYTDWRLPNRNELRSLANYSSTNNGALLNSEGMTNFGRSYWSSTSSNTLATNAWSLNMQSGYSFLNEKTDDVVAFNHVLPIRAGDDSASSAVAATSQSKCFNETGTIISCFGTGQDGDLVRGVSMPSPRFISNIDSSKTDEMTSLIWESNANLMVARDVGWDTDSTDDGAVTFDNALAYIAKLNAEAYLGHTDWRLPNIVELQSLVQNNETNSTWLSNRGFTNVKLASIYWTSDTYVSVSPLNKSAWVVQITSPTLNGGSSPAAQKTSDYFVWPVRG